MEYNNMRTEDTDSCTLLCQLIIVFIFMAAYLAAMKKDLEENNADIGLLGAYNRETGEYDAWLSWKWGFWDD